MYRKPLVAALIYNNLLYFITAIIIFSTGSIPDEPRIPFAAALFIFVLKGAAYYYLVHHAHAGGRALNDKGYFAVEQKFSFLAIFIFAVTALTGLLPVYADPIAIVGATIIDGNGGEPIRNGVIVIDNDRIAAVGDASTAIPKNTKTLQADGKYIIPGLMYANVHLVYGF